MIVDCMTCPVRGRRCDDCVVTMLGAPGSAEFPLDGAESRAVSMFVGANYLVTVHHGALVSARSVVGLCAHREPVEHWASVRAVG